MNSLTRTKLAVRSTLAELSLGTYLSTPMIGLAALGVFIYFCWLEQHTSYAGELMMVVPQAVYAIFASVAFFPALIISVNFFAKRFKHADRAEDFLLLPLSNGERFTFSLIFSWVVVPLITYLPILLLLLATSIIGHAYFIFPPLPQLLWIFLGALAMYYLLSVFWLFPAIAFPRFGLLVVFGMLGLAIGANILSYELLPSPQTTYSVDGSVFNDPGVVGMSEVAAYHKQSPQVEMDFAGTDDDIDYLPMLLASPFLLFAAFRAITRKKA